MVRDGVLVEPQENLIESSMECPKDNCTNELREPQVMNALSRRDNKTYICSDCGVAEAMEDFAKS